MKSALEKAWVKCGQLEERSNLFQSLSRAGVCTNDVRSFVGGQSKLKRMRKKKNKDGDALGKLAMEGKLWDSKAEETVARKKKDKLRRKFEEAQGKNSTSVRNFVRKMKEETAKVKGDIRKKNKSKIKHLQKKTEVKRVSLPKGLLRYKRLRILGDEVWKADTLRGPVIVDDDINLNKDEIAVLTRGPKFAIRKKLSLEQFLNNLESCLIKHRWDSKNNDLGEAETEVMTNAVDEDDEEETKRIEEEGEMMEAKSRLIFDQEDMSLNFARHKATDAKLNSRVILPKALSTQDEMKLEVRKMEMVKVFEDYVKEHCSDDEGSQKMNLSKSELRGLKSLKKKVKDGDIIICQTDKSGRFAVMRMETYLMAGEKHVKDDAEINLEDVKENQRVVNGHVAMWLKIFKVGSDWKHQSRHRETKINQSLGIAPVYLLFKDHKKWDKKDGSPPPTRPVASASSGMNIHFSSWSAKYWNQLLMFGGLS